MRLLRLLCAVPLIAAVAWGQAPERPRLAWIEPGAPAEYGFRRIAPDGAVAPVGETFAWDWIQVAPSGRYAAYWRRGEAALHIRNLESGADRAVADLSLVSPKHIRMSTWRGDTLWLLLQPGANRPAALWAVAAAVPAGRAVSGTLPVVSVTPTDDGAAAYALATVGSGASDERQVALCFADGRTARILGERHRVVGGRIVESDDRVALFATRSDRAGYSLLVCDRDSGQEVLLNPEAGAFEPAFCRGYGTCAYLTRHGIVVQELGGEPRVVAPHLPDRRFALTFGLTPSGDALLVETPTDRTGRTRTLTRYPLSPEGAPVEIGRVEAPAMAGGSSLSYSEDGARLIVVTPLGDEAGSSIVHVGPVAGPLVAVARGRLLATRLSHSARVLALAVAPVETLEASVLAIALDAPPGETPASVRLAAREQHGQVELPSFALQFAPTDDRLLVTGIPAGETRPSAFLVDAPGAPARLLTGDGIVRSASWSPGGERVLVQALVGWGAGNSTVGSLVAVETTTAAHRATVLSGDLRLSEQWVTPDGSVLGLAELRGASRRLVVCRAAREALTVSGEIDAEDPVWAPDGSALAFRSPVAQPPFAAVYTARPQTEPLLVSGELLADGRPVWLPDGKRLFFTSVRSGADGPTRVGCLASSGGGAPRVLGPMDRPALLPDRSGVLYHAVAPKEGVYRLDFADGATPALLGEGYQGALPSPDGRTALVVREGPDGLAAALVPLVGGGLIPLPAPAYARLSWAPDSRHVAAVSPADGGTLTVVALDGTATTRLGSGGIEDLAWSPAGDRLAALTYPADGAGQAVVTCWSLDGTEIARAAWPASLHPLRTAPATLAMLLEVPSEQLTWSPDGQAVVSIAYDADGASVTARVLLPTTQESFPLGIPGSVAGLVWAPDGHTLAGIAYAEAPSEASDARVDPRPLYIGQVSEGRFRRLPGAPAVEGAAWTPDGRVCFWATEGAPDMVGTFVANPDGTGLFRLGSAAAAAERGTVWPLAPQPTRTELLWRPVDSGAPIEEEG